MNFWRFMDGTYDVSAALNGSYDPFLVVLSFLVATLAGFAALSVTPRIRAAENKYTRRIWTAAGGLAMGTGIWSMHFVAMLAFSIPVAVAYDLTITVLSMVPAFIGSALALRVVSGRNTTTGSVWGGGILLGVAIGAMHYTGMEAMEMPAALRYQPVLFLVSLVVAKSLGITAFRVKYSVENSQWRNSLAARFGTAGILGAAVAGMHYTAMAAARFFPVEGGAPISPQTNTMWLVGLVTVITVAIVGATILMAILDSSRMMQMRAAVESNPSGFAYYHNGRLVVLNSAMRDMFPELEDKLVPGVRYESVIRAWEKAWGALPGNTSADDYIKLRREPDASTQFSYETNLPDGRVAAVKEQGTSQGGLVSVWHDVTEIRKAQQQLVQHEKLASLGQMVGGVAHEINTPLGYVHSNVTVTTELLGGIGPLLDNYQRLASLVEQKGVTDPEISAELQKIKQQDASLNRREEIDEAQDLLQDSLTGLNDISDLVVNLRDFCRVDPSKVASFDVNEGLEKTLTIARNKIKDKLEVVKRFGDVPAVSASPSQINQVFLNLINNAAQAMESPGHLWLDTREENDEVVVEVTDDGPGMPEEVRDRIYDPFFTTKDVGEGTGMGLSIAYRILEQHEARIEVDSAPGKGTRFTLRFPMAKQARRQEARTA